MKRNVLNLTLPAIGAAFLCLCAWLSFPLFGVPITMQVFGVALLTLLFPSRMAIAAVALYLCLGALGLPVFSSFGGGFGVLTGVTGGYLWGFLPIPLAAYLDRICRRRNRSRTTGEKNLTFRSLLPLVLGLILCYTVGTVQFACVASVSPNFPGVLSILSICVFPFLIPDGIKLLLAFYCARRLLKTGVLQNIV